MLTLLVEDDRLKSARIAEVIQLQFPGLDIHHKESFKSGMKAIVELDPRLVILDMTLPTFDGIGARKGRMRPLGGYELLGKMLLRKIQTSVIVVTGFISFGEDQEQVSFEEVRKKCASEFPRIFRDMIYYQQSNLEWQNALIQSIGLVIREAESC